MYSTVTTAILHGIDGMIVQAEADVSDGLPVFEMVGFLAAEVKESKNRVRTALRNCGHKLPARRITINLSPASVKKSGNGFDLPITVAIMAAMGIIDEGKLKNTLVIGELGLNGSILPVDGILPIILKGYESGIKVFVIPKENLNEALLVEGIKVVAVATLMDVSNYFQGEYQTDYEKAACFEEEYHQLDFSDVHGQTMAKRACEIAVSGMHNLLMIGPAGAGKTMLAKRIPGILPPMNQTERMEVSKIYSICGQMHKVDHLVKERPFRAPHHTISAQGLAGGGAVPKPGEVTMAHRGVLFLDELPEFDRNTIELLRQPLEDKQIVISRASGSYTYPADFLLVCAMNPCKCGFYPDMEKCRCTKTSIRNYLSKISQPLLDRMDLCVEAQQMTYQDLTQRKQEENSEQIRARVCAVQQIQQERFRDENWYFNSQIPVGRLEEYCELGTKEKQYMERMYEKLDLSARAYHKLLKVARTIADLDRSKTITVRHLTEAVCFRSLDKKYWEG